MFKDLNQRSIETGFCRIWDAAQIHSILSPFLKSKLNVSRRAKRYKEVENFFQADSSGICLVYFKKFLISQITNFLI